MRLPRPTGESEAAAKVPAALEHRPSLFAVRTERARSMPSVAGITALQALGESLPLEPDDDGPAAADIAR